MYIFYIFNNSATIQDIQDSNSHKLKRRKWQYIYSIQSYFQSKTAKKKIGDKIYALLRNREDGIFTTVYYKATIAALPTRQHPYIRLDYANENDGTYINIPPTVTVYGQKVPTVINPIPVKKVQVHYMYICIMQILRIQKTH